ncbi:HIT family protein [Arthrobacter sp. Ld5]|uniref:HIT family protein n=1 Tax=Arthrobacter sp. Ld5 TaxID=649152 RepID=UPI003EB72FFD
MTAETDACIFCDIVRGQAGSNMVYENDVVAAFMDTSPVTPGHVLVVPRQHCAYLEDVRAEVGAEMFRVAHRLARALRRSGLRCEGVNMFLADGEAAFQEVLHCHLHVFPRFDGDSFRIDADWQRVPLQQLEAPAQQLRNGLELLS